MSTATDKLRLAKAASAALGQANTLKKNEALHAISRLLPIRADQIIAANQKDLERGQAEGLSSGLQDRLRLDETRIAALAAAVNQIATLPDPVGQVVRGSTLPNGLVIGQNRVPFGVVGDL